MPSISTAHSVEEDTAATESGTQSSAGPLITPDATPSAPSVVEELSTFSIARGSDVQVDVVQPSTSAMVEAQNYFLKREVSELQEKLNRVSTFTFEQIEGDDSNV